MRRNIKRLLYALGGCTVFLAVSLLWMVPLPGGGPVPESAYFEDQEDRINVNTAPVLELMCLEGIGEKRAQAIVDYRETEGMFSSVDDLRKVPGISDGVLEKIQDHITF